MQAGAEVSGFQQSNLPAGNQFWNNVHGNVYFQFPLST